MRPTAKLLVILTATVSALLAAALPADARPARAVASSEIVVDAGSGHVLFSENADRVRPPASLAKMMTLLLTYEAVRAGRLSFGSPLVMTRFGASQRPTKLSMAVGSRMHLRDAMAVVAVISANDVAAALAQRVAGSESRFVAAMNRRAAQLGMTSTRFDNATGLAPSASVTSARDMAVLGRHIIALPDLYAMFSTRSISWKGRTRRNHNRLLGRVQGVDGLKTGYTVPAGFNLVASGRRGGRRIVAVVLGARTAAARDQLASNLLEEGFYSPSIRSSTLAVRHRPDPVFFADRDDERDDEDMPRARPRRRRYEPPEFSCRRGDYRCEPIPDEELPPYGRW